MSLLKSAVNQVGRDLGKVISNQIFKDAHSTPIRMTNQSGGKSNRKVKSEFEKSINIALTLKPNTIVNKMAAAYIELKNEVEEFLSDGYLEMDELKQLVNLFNTYNKKASDITELLEMDEDKNKEEIEKLTELVQKNKELLIRTIEVGIKAAENSLERIESYKKEETKGVFRFLSNSKIKKHNDEVENSINARKQYVVTLQNVLKQINNKS